MPTPIATTTVEPPKVRPWNIAERADINYEDVEHIVREDDPDTSLCGVDQTDVPWNQGFPWCQACLAVAHGQMN